MWECTECNVENELDPEAEEEQILTCVECGAEYEIVSLDPLDLELLDLASEESDDDEADWEE